MVTRMQIRKLNVKRKAQNQTSYSISISISRNAISREITADVGYRTPVFRSVVVKTLVQALVEIVK